MTPPKMPIHIGDYKRDTGHLRALEHGAYLLLLFHHWSTGALPDDDRQLSAIACMTPAEWKKAKPILSKFFDNGWVHGRVVKDLAEANAAYERRAKAGRESGKARSRGEHCSNNAPATQQQPITDNQEEDRIGDARERVSSFTDGSKALATSFLNALGFDTPLKVPPEFAGVDWRAIEWERAGWTADLIEAEARKNAGKPLSYHEKCFATAFAKRQAPLPVAVIKNQETVHVAKSSRGGISSALDRLIEQAEGNAAGSFEGGQATTRLLSHG